MISKAKRPKSTNSTRGRVKANSTSSLFLSKLIPHSADAHILVKCFSRAVYYEVLRNRYVVAGDDIFNEKLHPLDSAKNNFDLPPKQRQVEELLSRIFTNQILSAECSVMAAAYVEKMKLRKMKLCPANWRRILLGALLLAEKVWEDQAVSNIDYTKSFPEMCVEDLRQLERAFLIRIQFELTLRPSEYAKYYFGLISLREHNVENYPIRPLDKKTARDLEAKSKGFAEVVKMAYVHDRPYKSHNNYSHQSTITLEQLQKIRTNYGNMYT